MSPEGGSTLTTSAPKSERITAAAGAATKVERSTTLRPEKMLSLAIGFLLNCRVCFSGPGTAGRASRGSGRAFLLVLRPGAQAEIGGFEDEALALTCIHSLVHRFERLLDCDGSVRSDHLQDGFCTRDEIGRRNDLITR